MPEHNKANVAPSARAKASAAIEQHQRNENSGIFNAAVWARAIVAKAIIAKEDAKVTE